MRIQKEQLCNSCRKIHPLMNNGKYWFQSIEDLLDDDRNKNPMECILTNNMILAYLQMNGGCSKCINLFTLATQS
jgi:hypothetical protein